jgi:uncharacterized protein YecT (DUF1311 family)
MILHVALIARIIAFSLSSRSPAVPCVDQDLSEVALGACLDKEVVVVDAELNRTYQAVLKTLPAQQRELLRTAERAWIRSRDADLALFEASVQGNHPSILIETEQVRVIRERTRFLETYRS